MGDVMIIIKCCSLMASLIFSSAVITYWLTKSKYQELLDEYKKNLEDKERYCVLLGQRLEEAHRNQKDLERLVERDLIIHYGVPHNDVQAQASSRSEDNAVLSKR